MDLLRRLRGWLRPRKQAVCARVGESLGPPPGSVIRRCQRCQNPVTVAPLTFRQLGRRFEIICVQCAAAENPDMPLTPMSPEDILIFAQQRGGLPDQCFRTIGEMNAYMNRLFKDRNAK